MKQRVLLAIAVALVAIPAAVASSGGFDSRGGHHCRTNCASQGYYTNQYHCHRAPCGKADIRAHKKHGH